MLCDCNNPTPRSASQVPAITMAYADGEGLIFVRATEEGLDRETRQSLRPRDLCERGQFRALVLQGQLVSALNLRGSMTAAIPELPSASGLDSLARWGLGVPRSERWREALSTALASPWCDALLKTGHLPATALGALKAEARTLHGQLVPLWRRRTRHGRVLSLDAALGDGLSLYDLVAVDVDLLARAAGGVFEDERLNAVLRTLDEEERRVVFAYAEGEGTTWAEAAAAAGATDPQAFGERVRRKALRQAGEQRRRAAQRYTGFTSPR